jgi:hypothetical protein
MLPVAGLGGFSGRESAVSLSTSSSSSSGSGASALASLFGSGASTGALYDCRGRAAAISARSDP